MIKLLIIPAFRGGVRGEEPDKGSISEIKIMFGGGCRETKARARYADIEKLAPSSSSSCIRKQ